MSAVDVAQVLWLALAALGLNLAVGLAGQPILGQGAFVSVGGYGTVLLADRGDLPLGVAAAVAVVGAGVLGWLVAFGSSRLRGAYLALATWGLAWLVFAVLTAFPGLYGGSQGLVRRSPARLVSRFLGLEVTLTPVWHVVMAGALCLGVMALTRCILRGPVGLDLAALRAGPAAAESLGIDGAALRRNTLAAAAAIGALSGAGTAVLLGLIAPADVSPLLSVQLYVAVLVGGTASLWGPLVGVALLVALPSVADLLSGTAEFSVERSRGMVTAALLVAVLALREPVVRRVRAARPDVDVADRGEGRPPALAEPDSSPDPGGRAEVSAPSQQPAEAAAVLEARGLHHSYGELVVLAGVDLAVRAGEVHALVGPNGSGKTTTLRLLAGALAVQRGQVECAGRDVTGQGQRDRVRSGIVRTFQQTALFPGLSVLDHLRAGARGTERGGGVWRALLRTPSWQAAALRSDAVVKDLLGRSGLVACAPAQPEELTHGEQRLLQVVRAAAAQPLVVLLDEPAAGMSKEELHRLRDLVRDLAGNGMAVLLVEHDMRFVAAVADRMTVLAAGRVIATGRPDDVRRMSAVRAAYLGGTPEEDTL
ncbi:MAG TPA: ATP-binding cassette domain-containing protein [Mycobacteriales bacterium]|nr:ATP-binding cassette domain-containing protein [Mycobacteriales bacterium]